MALAEGYGYTRFFMLSVTEIKIWKAREIKKEKGRIKNLEGKVEEGLSCVL